MEDHKIRVPMLLTVAHRGHPVCGLRAAVICLMFLVQCFAFAQSGSGSANPLWSFPTDVQAMTDGPGHPWQASTQAVQLYSLCNNETIPILGWTARGGLPVGLALHHSSMALLTNSSLGAKWTHSYDTRVVLNKQRTKAAVVWGDHRIQMFQKVQGAWMPTDGYRDSLTPMGQGFELSLKDQTRLQFEGNGSMVPVFRIKKIVDSQGNALVIQYDVNGRTSVVSDPSGRTIEFSYQSGKVFDIKFMVLGVAQRTWKFEYDGLGRLSQVQLPPVTTETGIQNYSYSIGYNPQNNITVLSRPDGGTWQFGYQASDRIAYVQPPANTAMERFTFEYQSNGQRRVTDPIGHSKTYVFDGASRLTEFHDDTEISSLAYSDPDYMFGASSVQSPSGTIHQFDYDPRGNLLGIVDGAGNRWDYSYDSRNNLVQALEPLVTDAWGVVETGRHKTEFVYDANNNLADKVVYDHIGNFNFHCQYDSMGQLLHVTDPLNHTWDCTYDAFGNAISFSTPTGRTIRVVYDLPGSTAGFTRPNAWIDGLGVRTELRRDEWGRLRRADYPADPDRFYEYDPMGRLRQMLDGTGQTNYQYDANGNLVQAIKGNWICDLTYLANGLRSTLDENSGSGAHHTDYSYNSRNFLSQLVDDGWTSNFSYDADGHLAQRMLANGAKSTYGWFQGRLSSVIQSNGTGGTMVGYSYFYQANGRLMNVSEFGGPETKYGYDFLNRTTREARSASPAYEFNWTYNPTGDRTSQNRIGAGVTTYQYDNDDLLIQAMPPGSTPELYQNDANGRLVQRTRNSGSEIFRFKYDTQGDLTAMQLWNGAAFDPYSSYSYDGRGQRSNKLFVGGLSATDSYAFDPVSGDMLRDDRVVGGNSSTQLMTWAGGLLRQRFLNTNQLWAATDGLGSMRASTNGQGQDSGFRQVCNAFGETVETVGAASAYQFGADFGARTEGDAGLIVYNGHAGLGANFYDPVTGRSMGQGLSGRQTNYGAGNASALVDTTEFEIWRRSFGRGGSNIIGVLIALLAPGRQASADSLDHQQRSSRFAIDINGQSGGYLTSVTGTSPDTTVSCPADRQSGHIDVGTILGRNKLMSGEQTTLEFNFGPLSLEEVSFSFDSLGYY